MTDTAIVLLQQDQQQLVSALDRLRDDANACFVMLLDAAGQELASAGDLEDMDATSLASLAAGNVATTSQLARLVGEDRFSNLLHEGEQRSLHLSVLSGRMILLVGFDQHSSQGLVRLRVEQHEPGLTGVVSAITSRTEPRHEGAGSFSSVVSEISDEDIDALFD